MGRHYNPKIVTANLLFLADFANPAFVNNSTLSITSPYSNLTLTAFNAPTYVNVSNGVVTYSRAATANSVEKPTAGGYHISPNMSSVVGLRYNEFYYNDHTFEIWVKISDTSSTNYDGTENNSFLAGHRGYNIGYQYNSSTIYYNIWDTSAASFAAFNFDFNSSTGIQVGAWTQLVVTREGTNYKKYVNGKYIDANTRAAPGINTGTSNAATLSFGAHWASGQNFLYYSNSSISNVKMYNRALTGEEVAINFAATRGRFGI